MKICKDCKKEKPESEFYGVQGECKECSKKRIAQNYRKKIDYYRQYEVRRNKKPARKEKKLEYQRKRRTLSVEKYKANSAVRNALYKGLLVKKPCEVCGNIKSEAHHPDYSKPLDVMWLCLKHHREWHKKYGNQNNKSGSDGGKS